MDDVIRVGTISAVDGKNGTARVYYPDRAATTAFLQLFAFGAEYAPPKVGDQVLVLHLSNDTSAGVIMGRFWGQAQPPPQNVVYQKNFSESAQAVLANNVLMVSGPEIRLSNLQGAVTLSELLELERRVAALEARI